MQNRCAIAKEALSDLRSVVKVSMQLSLANPLYTIVLFAGFLSNLKVASWKNVENLTCEDACMGTRLIVCMQCEPGLPQLQMLQQHTSLF